MLSRIDPEGLQAYFTDAGYLRQLFREWITAPVLPKQLLVIHGIGGVGKSSLLRMFRLECKRLHIPAAIVSGDESNSVRGILSNWAEDLHANGVSLPRFSETLKQYRAIQEDVEQQAIEAQPTPNETTQTSVKTLSALSNISAKALADWLLTFLSKSDTELFLDPAKKLTGDLLLDLAKAASKQRIVIMLDTFEHLGALEDWALDIVQALPPNVLFIIAGRELPNWSSASPGWVSQAAIEELAPLSDGDMRTLVRKYYAYIRGGEPDSKLVDSIVSFGHGLPIVATSAVTLFTKYGVTDFQTVEPTVVADLVDRLLSEIPKDMISAVEEVATVRWFNKEILGALIATPNVDSIFDTLCSYSFVRLHREGFSMHLTLREILEENMRTRNPERVRVLHERAAAYFESHLSRASGEEAWTLGLELLYHRVRADEDLGIRLCEEITDELVRYRRIERLRILMNEANAYRLEKESSQLWFKYFKSRLAKLEEQIYRIDWANSFVGEKAVEPSMHGPAMDIIEYDIFISHAWEDKPFARNLAEALKKRRLRIWYDEFSLSVGDKLRRSIDRGLANSRYGIVILSPHFFAKEWPQKELDGLVSRETLSKKVILPIWHNITFDQVRKYSPTLADRVAVSSDRGLDQVVDELLRAMQVFDK